MVIKCCANSCLSGLPLDEGQEEWPRLLMLDRRLAPMMLDKGSEVEPVVCLLHSFFTHSMMNKPLDKVCIATGLLVKYWPLSPIRVSGQRCQREARSKGCSLQNPWQRSSGRSPGCSTDDQLPQTGAEYHHTVSCCAPTGPEPCAADTDTQPQ